MSIKDDQMAFCIRLSLSDFDSTNKLRCTWFREEMGDFFVAPPKDRKSTWAEQVICPRRTARSIRGTSEVTCSSLIDPGLAERSEELLEKSG
ncbi:MAG: hypothetical protein DMG06_01455 [Acidobacteria bacterium]|nr:MAG: hypothetical protein DMG06_01455 [Acidobacteriota bacterium]